MVTDVFAADQVGVIVSEVDPTAQLLIQLGFTLSPAVTEVEPGRPGGTTGLLSPEHLDRLEADVLFGRYGSPEARAALGANPLFSRLDMVQRGAHYVFTDDVRAALRSPSALAVPYFLDVVVPELATVDFST